MDSAQDLRSTHSHCYACVPPIQKFQQATLLSQALRNNSALCSTINKGLDIVPIHFHVHVKHGDVPKEFWEILLSVLQVLINQILSDHVFDFLLSFHIKYICVLQSL